MMPSYRVPTDAIVHWLLKIPLILVTVILRCQWEGTLQAGDMLYIPRGWVCAARTTAGAPSLHLSIAAKSAEHTVHSFIQRMLQHHEEQTGQSLKRLKQELKTLGEPGLLGLSTLNASNLRISDRPMISLACRSAPTARRRSIPSGPARRGFGSARPHRKRHAAWDGIEQASRQASRSICQQPLSPLLLPTGKGVHQVRALLRWRWARSGQRWPSSTSTSQRARQARVAPWKGWSSRLTRCTV